MNRRSLAVIISSALLLGAACWQSPQSSSNYGKIDPVTSPAVNGSPSGSNQNNKMGNNNQVDLSINSGGFMGNLPNDFTRPSDDVGKLLLKEYGSVFVARGGATPPPIVVFRDDASVATFQGSLVKTGDTVGGVRIELQAAAMKALKEAVAEAGKNGTSITPRGADAARRVYGDTVDLWKSRVDPGLAHWADLKRIAPADVQRIKALSPYDQVPEIFKLESQGMYFSKDLSKPIIYSVAPPGASQHLSMLALDVSEYANPKAREILAKHGWFQTVVSDLPHFTYLGIAESDLPKLGLKKVTDSGQTFWVPDI